MIKVRNLKQSEGTNGTFMFIIIIRVWDQLAKHFSGTTLAQCVVDCDARAGVHSEESGIMKLLVDHECARLVGFS